MGVASCRPDDQREFQAWFLGINPRGLVPVLVHDGAVHIESNDIIAYLEKTFPQPRLVPEGRENEVGTLLKHEDDLHFDLRRLSFRFVFAPPGPAKSPDALKSYAANGSGTVQGVKDAEKAAQIEFWERANKDDFTDADCRKSARTFRAEFDALGQRLATQPYLCGNDLTVLDIAWFIYTNRLALAGYPFAKLHPNVNAWFQNSVPGRNSPRRWRCRRRQPHTLRRCAGSRRRRGNCWSRWQRFDRAPERLSRRPGGGNQTPLKSDLWSRFGPTQRLQSSQIKLVQPTAECR
jgi:glutathione S-transferase